MRLADHFEGGDQDVHQDGDHYPAQDDRDRKDADRVGEVGAVAALGLRQAASADRAGGFVVFGASGAGIGLVVHIAHADFTRQKVWALWPSEFWLSRTTPSTVILQLIVGPLLCAMMLALTEGNVVEIVVDHGSGALST